MEKSFAAVKDVWEKIVLRYLLLDICRNYCEHSIVTLEARDPIVLPEVIHVHLDLVHQRLAQRRLISEPCQRSHPLIEILTLINRSHLCFLALYDLHKVSHYE